MNPPPEVEIMAETTRKTLVLVVTVTAIISNLWTPLTTSSLSLEASGRQENESARHTRFQRREK